MELYKMITIEWVLLNMITIEWDLLNVITIGFPQCPSAGSGGTRLASTRYHVLKKLSKNPSR